MTRTMSLVTLAVLTLLTLAVLLVGTQLAAASEPGSCPTWNAERDVREAHAALHRAEARLAEAKRVLTATRSYSSSYGSSVGRWVRLARREGFSWSQVPTALAIINRESKGDPRAKNPYSTASGLWQFLSSWWAGKWNPFDPVQSMHHAQKAVEDGGWSPWSIQ